MSLRSTTPSIPSILPYLGDKACVQFIGDEIGYIYTHTDNYYYKCLVDYIYQCLNSTFPKKLNLDVKLIYCCAVADEVIYHFNNPHEPDVDGCVYKETEERVGVECHSVFTFKVFERLRLFADDIWGYDLAANVYRKARCNYNNLKKLCKLSGLCNGLNDTFLHKLSDDSDVDY